MTPADAAGRVLAAGEALEGLDDLPGALVVQRKRGRSVVRADLEGGRVFLKHFAVTHAADGRAERDAYRRLAVLGVPTAPLLHVGEDAAGALVLVIGDAGPGLDDVLALEGHRPAKRRARLAEAARTIRALHLAGCAFPDLLARHLRIGSDGAARLIDLQRLRGPGVLRPSRRAVDWGAFFGTLPRLAVPERDRLRLFVAATPDLDRAGRRALARRVLKETRRTRDRTRHRHGYVEIDPAHRDRLEGKLSHRIIHFDTGFDDDLGERLRRLDDRENRRWEVDGTTYFLKRHFHGSRAAVDELEAALAFRRQGVPAVLPAAWGEDVDRGSFWCAAAADGEPLDDLLARPGAVPAAARRDLARRLGGWAARMRRAGLRHRDFYLNHWIGRWSADEGWTLALIDLQRAGPTGLRTERWFVKDAAQLWYSARRTPATRTDGLRFVHAALGIRRLDARARKFIRRVLRKAERMAARRPRTPVR